MTATTTSGHQPSDCSAAVFGAKVHQVKGWKRHPYNARYVIPALACGSRSRAQFPSPIHDSHGIPVDCQRCLAAK